MGETASVSGLNSNLQLQIIATASEGLGPLVGSLAHVEGGGLLHECEGEGPCPDWGVSLGPVNHLVDGCIGPSPQAELFLLGLPMLDLNEEHGPCMEGKAFTFSPYDRTAGYIKSCTESALLAGWPSPIIGT